MWLVADTRRRGVGRAPRGIRLTQCSPAVAGGVRLSSGHPRPKVYGQRGHVKETENGMPNQDRPASPGGEDTGEGAADIRAELSRHQHADLRNFETSLSEKQCPQALRTLLVRLRTMQLHGGYTQQEPAKRFAAPYRTAAKMPPSYHKLTSRGAVLVDRRRVSEDMTGGRSGITVPPAQLVRFCAEVYAERTGNNDQTVLTELLRLREASVRQAREVERQRGGQAHANGPRAADSGQVQELQEETDQLMAGLAELRGHLDQVHVDKADLQARMAELSATLATVTDTSQHQAQHISDLHIELTGLRDGLAAKEQLINELTADRDRLHRQSARLRGETDRMQARLVGLDTSTTTEQEFEAIVEGVGPQWPPEPALVGGGDVRQDPDTHTPRGDTDRAGQQPAAPPSNPADNPTTTTKTTAETPERADTTSPRSMRGNWRQHPLIAPFITLGVVTAVLVPVAWAVAPSGSNTPGTALPITTTSSAPAVLPDEPVRTSPPPSATASSPSFPVNVSPVSQAGCITIPQPHPMPVLERAPRISLPPPLVPSTAAVSCAASTPAPDILRRLRILRRP